MTKPSKNRRIPFRGPTTFEYDSYQAEQGRQRQQQQMQRRQQMLNRQDVERQRNPEQFQQKLQQRHQDPAYRALNAGKAPKYY